MGKDAPFFYVLKKRGGRLYSAKNSNKDHYIYAVKSVNAIKSAIIPHFVQYPILSSKNLSFLLFKYIVEIIINKEHLTPEGVPSGKNYVY